MKGKTLTVIDSKNSNTEKDTRAKWIDETWRNENGETEGRTVALELDDGTRLENYETVLRNKYGEEETFEVTGLRFEEFTWYGWGPNNITAKLSKWAIQSMYDAGELEVVND